MSADLATKIQLGLEELATVREQIWNCRSARSVSNSAAPQFSWRWSLAYVSLFRLSVEMKTASLGLGCFLMLVTPRVAAQDKHEVDLGGIVVTVSVSRTAQVFHVVDQLSQWDEATHRNYVRWADSSLGLEEVDAKLLQQHAELRRARGWGSGFEAAFYVDDVIEVAARNAVASGLLSPEEAAAEKAILLHFAPKLADLLDRGVPLVAAFEQRLVNEAEKIAPVVRDLVRFSEVRETITVPLFLVPNPEEGSGGGGFNGGKLVVEVQGRPDPLPMLFHECLHALLWQHQEAVRGAAQSAGLTFGALNEGIVYAFAPGLTDGADKTDSLAEALVRNVRNGTPASDSYVQAYAVALVTRPVLQSALNQRQTFTTFLPNAVANWRRFAGR